MQPKQHKIKTQEAIEVDGLEVVIVREVFISIETGRIFGYAKIEARVEFLKKGVGN